MARSPDAVLQTISFYKGKAEHFIKASELILYISINLSCINDKVKAEYGQVVYQPNPSAAPANFKIKERSARIRERSMKVDWRSRHG